MRNKSPKKMLLTLGFVLLVAALTAGVLKFRDIFNSSSPQPTTEQQPSETEEPDTQAEEPTEPTKEDSPTPPATLNKDRYSVSEAGSLWWVVNKARPLNPKTYVPPNLVYPNVPLRAPGDASMHIRSDVAVAAKQLFDAAKAAGYAPLLSSGYRSYNTQNSVYNGYVASDGQAAADTYSARPGHSEHQTGLAFDICNSGNCQLEESFADTGLGKWVAQNAHRYGFTIRYHKGKQHITGFTYEPWHLRYVGTDLASELYKTGLTLEEYFELPAAPNYL